MNMNNKGNRLGLATAVNRFKDDPTNDWGMFTVDFSVKKLNTSFEYKKRITAPTQQMLRERIVSYILGEKLQRQQLSDVIDIQYEGTYSEQWQTSDIWRAVLAEQRLRNIAQAAKKKREAESLAPFIQIGEMLGVSR